MLAAQAQGAEIVTIEGIARADGTLHPMQEAFRDHHGLQCGFCTPGMVMSAIDIAKSYSNLTEEVVRAELDGNMCRCTGYHNIVKAVLAGAQNMRS
jgi:carbon-monoxide dehydrogenase small subunit